MPVMVNSEGKYVSFMPTVPVAANASTELPRSARPQRRSKTENPLRNKQYKKYAKLHNAEPRDHNAESLHAPSLRTPQAIIEREVQHKDTKDDDVRLTQVIKHHFCHL
jgi:hypothetical protein